MTQLSESVCDKNTMAQRCWLVLKGGLKAMNTAHTFSRRWLRRPLKVVFAVVAIAALAACARLPLYNKEKDNLAQSAQKAYTDTKVTETLDVQEQNLEMLLKAETAALNESASLRLDIALLRMSDDRPTTDGSTSLAGWYERAKTAEKNLGFPDSSRILAFLDYQIEVAQAEIQIATVKARIGSDGSKARKALPSCKAVRNDDLANLISNGKKERSEGLAELRFHFTGVLVNAASREINVLQFH